MYDRSMLVLILETSSEKGCVILAENGVPIEVVRLPSGPALSKNIALEVKKIVKHRKLDAIAVGTGPGSYTGIRVGAALAKALSYGWKVPLLGFCSLEAFGPNPVLVDARSAGFYALLDKEPILASPEDPILQTFPLFSSPHPQNIKKKFNGNVEEVDPDPRRLAELVYEQLLKGASPSLEIRYLAFP
jgi:tRNA threonylcarbamoyl adenosine modification protein YeaZ